jgi:hypothetical protein
VKLFSCPSCKLVVFFGNIRCVRCTAALGYEPASNAMIALEQRGTAYEATAGRQTGTRWKYCGNYQYDVCNWLLPDGVPDDLCRACRHNETIPDISVPENVALWRRMEEAKHRLLYTVLALELPLFDRTQRPDGLAFNFLRSDQEKVVTGHAGGLITISLVEADDAEREKRRTQLHEPYRTLLGHFRHEIGHWYWDQLIRDKPEALNRFTQLFGDSTRDYGEALETHYANGPVANWQETFVSAYATSHPWEDFAETWAHYFHMIDTLETGGSFGIVLQPKLDQNDLLSTSLDFDVYDDKVSLEKLVDAWIAIASALNSFNRSMGIADAYPFVLSPKVIDKLGFVHALVHGTLDSAR